MKNPFAQMKQPIQLSVTGSHDALEAIEAAVEDEVFALTRLLGGDQDQARQIKAERHYGEVVPRQIIELRLLLPKEQGERMCGMIAAVWPSVSVQETPLADIDWVAQVQKDFKPFRLGRFYVHGSHVHDHAPPNSVPLLIDAVAAFGTGEHATTAGCLQALARLRKQRKQVARVLDMGCGTAILAIAAAKLWPVARVDACDSDATAVRVSAHNLRANRVHRHSRAWKSDGYKPARVRRSGPHEVIVANILARPLMRMARAASLQLAPGGVLVLSGLLRSQERMVLAAHRAQGRYLIRRMHRDHWSVLVLR